MHRQLWGTTKAAGRLFERLQIKWTKQNLKIKVFYGQLAFAVKIQICTANSGYLIILIILRANRFVFEFHPQASRQVLSVKIIEL